MILVYVSSKLVPYVELILHDLAIKHYHTNFNKILVPEDGLQVLSEPKYYNIIGRYTIPVTKPLVEKFVLTPVIQSNNFTEHMDVHLVTKYRGREVIYAGIGRKLDTSKLADIGEEKVTIIYINYNNRGIHTKFSAKTKWLLSNYNGEDLSKLAIRVDISKGVRDHLITWLVEKKLPSYVDESDGNIYIYDSDLIPSIQRRFGWRARVKMTVTEGPEYGYLLGINKPITIPQLTKLST